MPSTKICFYRYESATLLPVYTRAEVDLPVEARSRGRQGHGGLQAGRMEVAYTANQRPRPLAPLRYQCRLSTGTYSQWRWHIPQINDRDHWHHYAISVDFPQVRTHNGGGIYRKSTTETTGTTTLSVSTFHRYVLTMAVAYTANQRLRPLAPLRYQCRLSTGTYSQWRWHIPQINDRDHWHHYAISVDFPQVCCVLSTDGYSKGKLVYAPRSNGGHIVFVLSVCLLSTLTFAITFEP